jgi:hypothetical protein
MVKKTRNRAAREIRAEITADRDQEITDREKAITEIIIETPITGTAIETTTTETEPITTETTIEITTRIITKIIEMVMPRAQVIVRAVITRAAIITAAETIIATITDMVEDARTRARIIMDRAQETSQAAIIRAAPAVQVAMASK